VAVAAFLAGTLPFVGIAETIEGAVMRWGSDDAPGLEAIVALDGEVRAALSTDLGLGGSA